MVETTSQMAGQSKILQEMANNRGENATQMTGVLQEMLDKEDFHKVLKFVG
jgi:hypothetical protein